MKKEPESNGNGVVMVIGGNTQSPVLPVPELSSVGCSTMTVSFTNDFVDLRVTCVVILTILFFSSQSFLVSAGTNTCESAPSSLLPPPFHNLTNIHCHRLYHHMIMRFHRKDNVVTIILSNTYTSGWVGIGFSKDGRMVGSSAMVGWAGNRGRADIHQYHLRGMLPSEIIHGKGELPLTKVPPAVVLDDKTIFLAFQLHFQHLPKHQSIILAYSTKTPDTHHLSIHENKFSRIVDFSTGDTKKDTWSLQRSHGILAVAGWGVFLPVGAIVGRYLRHWDPLWFYLHVCIQSVGFILGLATAITGKVVFDRMSYYAGPHQKIGTIILVLSIFQISAFFVRPRKDAKSRKYWNWCHHWFGRTALILAPLNIFIGVFSENEASRHNPSYVGYFITVVIVLVILVVFEVLMCMRKGMIWFVKRDKTPVLGMNSSTRSTAST